LAKFFLYNSSVQKNTLRKRLHKNLVQAGNYVAEVDVELFYTDDGWSPYISVDDAQKLDEVREALRQGDLGNAARQARVYTLTPLAI
jgi:hypothetical protein